VLNGSGVDGVATAAAARLSKAGYTIVGVADAESQDFTSTVVRFDPASETSTDAARTLSASLKGATRVQRDGLGTYVEVVVGQDWPGVTPVVVKKEKTDDGVRSASEDICDIPG
jgi:hypothetical protein